MSILPPKQHSDIYQTFKEIESGQYRTIIRFYEEYRKEINTLDFEEFFELNTAYVLSLFEIGAYESFLVGAEPIIEDSVLHNIKFFRGRDIFQELLFKKAKSHFYILQYNEAAYVLKELIKMRPDESAYVKLLKKTMSCKKPAYVSNTRAISVFVFIVTTVVIAAEVLVIRNFWSIYATKFEIARNSLFVIGLLILAGGDLAHYFQVNKRAEQFVRTTRALKQKQKKEAATRDFSKQLD